MANSNTETLPTIKNERWGDFSPFNKKQFSDKIRSLDTKLDGLEMLVHQLMTSAVFYVQEYGDYNYVIRVMTSVRKSPVLRGVAVQEWFSRFSNITLVEDAETGVVTARKNRNSKVEPNWEAAYATPFWTIKELNETVQKDDYTFADAAKEFFRLSAKIQRMVENKGTVHMSPVDRPRILMLKEQIDKIGPEIIEKAKAVELASATETTEEGATSEALEPAGEIERRTGTLN